MDRQTQRYTDRQADEQVDREKQQLHIYAQSSRQMAAKWTDRHM